MSGFDQNVGVPGVVYILGNDGLRANFWKIGSSRYSGQRRATDLNRDASTGTPGLFYVAHEVATLDCGGAEKEAHRRMAACRRGRHGVIEGRAWGQEFFEVDLELAKSLVADACSWADEQVATRSLERNVGRTTVRAEQVPAGGAGVRTAAPPAARRTAVWAGAAAIAVVMCMLVWRPPAWEGQTSTASAAKTTPGAAAFATQRPATGEIGLRSSKTDASNSAAATGLRADSMGATKPHGDRQGASFPSKHALFFTRTGHATGTAEMRIELPSGGSAHAVAVVARVPQYTPYAKVYVSAGETVAFKVPPGEFQVLAMTGSRWLGQAEMFGPAAELKAVGKRLTVDENEVGATDIILGQR